MTPIRPALILALSVIAGSGTVQAMELDGLEWAVVSDEVLAEQRGGLFSRDGIEMRLGIEQMTAVNGELINHRVMSQGDLGGLLLRADLQGTVLEHFNSTGWTTVLQNRQSDQVISHFTILDLDLAGMGMLNRAVTRGMIDAELIGSLRTP